MDSNVFISVFENVTTVACLATESQEFDAHFLEKQLKVYALGIKIMTVNMYTKDVEYSFRPISSLRSATPYMRALGSFVVK